MQVKLRHGQIIECVTHKRKRQWKEKVQKPTNKCAGCWMVYLADKMDFPTYQEDIEAFISFSNAFPKRIQATSLEYIEVAE